MKKFLSLLLVLMMVFSCAVTASAVEVKNEGTQTVTITYTEPVATYVLNIPDDVTITDFASGDFSIDYATVTESANFWGKRLEVLMQPDTFTNPDDAKTNAAYNFKMTLEDGTSVNDLMLTFGYLSDVSTGALVSTPQHSEQNITDMALNFYLGAGPAFQDAIDGAAYTSTIQFNAAVLSEGETFPVEE